MIKHNGCNHTFDADAGGGREVPVEVKQDVREERTAYYEQNPYPGSDDIPSVSFLKIAMDEKNANIVR